jgi:hypothetical protein
VVSRALAGARHSGAQTQTLYLADEKPEYCIHCGHPCFTDARCVQEEAATVRSKTIAAADALVIGVPVYCWQVNALSAALFDKFRGPGGSWNVEMDNGCPAVGIAVAGGTGTGVFPALQSLYSWLCIWKFRPFEPLPVTRFNYDRALARAEALGGEIAGRQPAPFRGAWDVMVSYDNVPYMRYSRIDEFRWLAQEVRRSLSAHSEPAGVVAETGKLLDEGRKALETADAEAEARAVIEAYRKAAGAWDELESRGSS